MKDKREEMLDSILRPLADLYESGNPHWLPIKEASVEEREPLRECIAELLAQGTLRIPAGKLYGSFQFTDVGYTKYLPRIKALRALV